MLSHDVCVSLCIRSRCSPDTGAGGFIQLQQYHHRAQWTRGKVSFTAETSQHRTHKDTDTLPASHSSPCSSQLCVSVKTSVIKAESYLSSRQTVRPSVLCDPCRCCCSVFLMCWLLCSWLYQSRSQVQPPEDIWFNFNCFFFFFGSVYFRSSV